MSQEFLEQEENQKRSSHRLTISGGTRDYDETIDGPRSIMNPRYVAHTLAHSPLRPSVYDSVEPHAQTIMRSQDLAQQVDHAMRTSSVGGAFGSSNQYLNNDHNSPRGRGSLSRAQEVQLIQQSSDQSPRSTLNTLPSGTNSIPPRSDGGNVLPGKNTPPSVRSMTVDADGQIRLSESLKERVLARFQDIVIEESSGIRYGRPIGSPPWGISEHALFTTPNLEIPADILMKIGLRPIEDDLKAIETAYNEELHAAEAAYASEIAKNRALEETFEDGHLESADEIFWIAGGAASAGISALSQGAGLIASAARTATAAGEKAAQSFIARIARDKLPSPLKPDEGTVWQIPQAARDKIPEFLVKNEASANRGIGIKWSGTADKGRNYIRIDKGNPNAEFPAQRVDHVRINSRGNVIGKDGKVVKKTDEFFKPSKNPESHIPLEEWLRWKEWDSL
jgi:hypothetical protein